MNEYSYYTARIYGISKTSTILRNGVIGEIISQQAGSDSNGEYCDVEVRFPLLEMELQDHNHFIRYKLTTP